MRISVNIEVQCEHAIHFRSLGIIACGYKARALEKRNPELYRHRPFTPCCAVCRSSSLSPYPPGEEKDKAAALWREVLALDSATINTPPRYIPPRCKEAITRFRATPCIVNPASNGALLNGFQAWVERTFDGQAHRIYDSTPEERDPLIAPDRLRFESMGRTLTTDLHSIMGCFYSETGQAPVRVTLASAREKDAGVLGYMLCDDIYISRPEPGQEAGIACRYKCPQGEDICCLVCSVPISSCDANGCCSYSQRSISEVDNPLYSLFNMMFLHQQSARRFEPDVHADVSLLVDVAATDTSDEAMELFQLMGRSGQRTSRLAREIYLQVAREMFSFSDLYCGRDWSRLLDPQGDVFPEGSRQITLSSLLEYILSYSPDYRNIMQTMRHLYWYCPVWHLPAVAGILRTSPGDPTGKDRRNNPLISVE